MPGCVQCGRWTAPRWRRCPWCKRWTGAQFHPANPLLDAELHAFASVGTTVSAWVGLFGVSVLDGRPVLGHGSLVLAGLLLLSSLILLVAPWGYLVAQMSWGALLLGVGPAIWKEPGAGLLGALVPFLVFSAMALRWRVLTARLAGSTPASARAHVPRTGAGRCEWCAEAGARVRAPVWTFSAGFIAIRVPGLARELCLRHARLNAAPATLASSLFGWWSPWGLWWTPNALWDNVVNGGGTDESIDEQMQLRRRVGLRWLAPPLAVFTGLIAFPLLAMRAADLLSG